MVRFRAPYHVGWSRTEKTISNLTLLRAITYAALTLGLRDLVDDIANCRVLSSSLLPTIPRKDGRLSLLAPFPKLPRVGKASAEWITLRGLKEVISAISKCSDVPLVEVDGEEEPTEIKVVCEGKTYTKLVISNGIARLNDEALTDTDVLSPYRTLRNRIDRVTGSADFYPLSGIYALTPQWFILLIKGDVNINNLSSSLKLLEVTGLGGRRSGGWGRFEIVEQVGTVLASEEVELISRALEGRRKGYHVLLGDSIIKGFDERRSFINLRKIEGIAGDSKSVHKLPVLIIAGLGSTVYLTGSNGEHPCTLLKICTDELNHEPMLPFNTVMWGQVS